MGGVLYFAYGSCMNPEDLRRDVPDFEIIGPAVLHGYRVGFTRYSRYRRGGVADLVPSPEHQVEGVLYRIPEDRLANLDLREGAPVHYRRHYVAVQTRDGVVHEPVVTYVVTEKEERDIPPHPRYARTILRGARRLLSRAYVSQLRRRLRELRRRKGRAHGGRGRA